MNIENQPMIQKYPTTGHAKMAKPFYSHKLSLRARFIGHGNPRLRLLRRYSPRNDLEKEQQAKFLMIHLHLLFNPSASIFF